MLTFAAGELHAANATIARRWHLEGGVLHATALIDVRSGRSWLTPVNEPSLVPPGAALLAPLRVTWAVAVEPALPVEEPSERGTLTVIGADGRGWCLHVQVFTDGPGVTCRLELVGQSTTAATELAAQAATGVEGDHGMTSKAPADDLCERLRLASPHLHLIEVQLQDQTDAHDNLAHERRWRMSPAAPLVLRTCLIALEDPLTGDGVVLVKHAPQPPVRPLRMGPDVYAHDADVRLAGHGCGSTGQGYAWSVLVYRGAAWGRAAALHRWQRNLRAYDPARDGRLLSNTWGDRNRDGRINASFIATEIAAGAQLGVDVCQIDDGWQRGITANSVHSAQGGVWLGFWAADAQFWAPHPTRFPNGLETTAAAAQAAGLGLGLWFAPDSADDFANWRKDADAVLALHRAHRVDHVKIDGVKAHTKLAEGNLRKFFHAVLRESAGRVVFDLDITAEVRPGYFGAVEVGPLFVENRYSDWRRWWPHATLRNLWQLAWHIPPQRLRIESLNPQRCVENYGNDPLAPAAWPLEYALATTLVACPLGWFEVSSLTPEYRAAAAPLLAIWRMQRAELHGGTILPIGDCPDGAAWTGFCSVGQGVAHVLVFREHHADGARTMTLPPGVPADLPLTVIAGRGSARRDGHGLRVAIPAKLDWVWLRLG